MPFTIDLKLSNIMLRVEDKSILAEYEEAEIRKPSDRKFINGERTIYASRAFRHPRENAYGLPVLCDLGEARVGVPQAYAEIQPDIYKAPEILMQFGWGHSADIWNAACVVRHIFPPFPTIHCIVLSDSSYGNCWRPKVCLMVLTARDCTTIAITSMRW